MLRTLVVVSSLLGMSGCIHIARQTEHACAVEVGARTARVVFPTVAMRNWKWNRPSREPAHSVPNLAWSLYLNPGPAALHFEISRGSSGPMRSGTLANAIVDGETSVTWPSNAGGEFDTWRRVNGVQAYTATNQLILVITDSALVHELFYLNHATESRCWFGSDFEPEAEFDVDGKVRYRRD